MCSGCTSETQQRKAEELMPDKHNSKIANNEIGNGFDADLHRYRQIQMILLFFSDYEAI